jgi:hypothetical protein
MFLISFQVHLVVFHFLPFATARPDMSMSCCMPEADVVQSNKEARDDEQEGKLLFKEHSQYKFCEIISLIDMLHFLHFLHRPLKICYP